MEDLREGLIVSGGMWRERDEERGRGGRDEREREMREVRERRRGEGLKWRMRGGLGGGDCNASLHACVLVSVCVCM